MFCTLTDLANEATVEQFFVNRLLEALKYDDSQIKPKSSLEELAVNQGRRRIRYRPDYALEIDSKVRWIVEAKAATEDLDDHIGQCTSYCLELNRRATGENPVTHFVLTNGVETRVYEWDNDDPVLELDFSDFEIDNAKWIELNGLLAADQYSAEDDVPDGPEATNLVIRPASISEINAAFAWCHRFIYRREHLNYSAAFMEFVKIVFLKLLSDRTVHETFSADEETGAIHVPAKEVRFSTAWISEREKDHPSPVDAIQFRQLIDNLEEAIEERRKKRMFNKNEKIQLTPETIKGVVQRLEGLDLYSIDSDLNGRLFETFLNATLRGKDLGQFFTPRSVVKLATRLADFKVTPTHIDTVIDACCGTGGFLIESLSDMWSKIDNNPSLSKKKKNELRQQVATQHIFGVDVAKEPALARIARINMYLHGDGGSSIYQFDALDKAVSSSPTDSSELKAERSEFKRRTQESGFDVVLTNPPFAKEYARKQKSEEEILDQYKLAFDKRGKKLRPLPGLKSSIMFLERYHDLLRPGGRLVTVIDDSLLGGERESRIREYIRANFIIKAVISLPGDAFQRSQARVKTSVVILEKKQDASDEQPAAFMYYCTRVGVDDVARQRVLPIDEINRREADSEVDTVYRLYKAFLNGEPEASPWVVPPEALMDRIDVKACLPKRNRNVGRWKEQGLEVVPASDLIEPAYLVETGDDDEPYALNPERVDDVISTSNNDEEYTHLRVRYDGGAERAETIVASDSNYKTLYRVRSGDIVVSHINAVHGAITVIPPELEGFVVTPEYTVCRAKEGVHPFLVWQLLRTPEARSDLILSSTGIGRSRVDWANIKDLNVPIPPLDLQEAVISATENALELERQAKVLREQATVQLGAQLNMDNYEARDLLAAFKPPR